MQDDPESVARHDFNRLDKKMKPASKLKHRTQMEKADIVSQHENGATTL